ncbi:alpha/beta-hydrolase [Westerdykella ornata]|uniref:Alpha/beta-hydrolase n=1 Tax=Westerdykella ornata TaxID=318751 RepID=A0A6A6JJJ4_WESOR|nr:alpha/beta-hydrolase [Westerdykella ornata]KAF2276158.1 alpha/beta-hydrolase [Westerdykella ornata]
MDGRVITPDELAQAQRFGDLVPVYKVDERTVVKTGDCVRLAEAEALKLVREKTTIPVPEVYNAYTDSDTGHVRIVMEFIEGDRLDDVWDKLDNDQKKEVIEQLRDFISQLREIKGSFIGSVDSTACEDQLFTDEIGGYGPYKDEESFNVGIATAVKRTLTGSWADTVTNMVMALRNHDIVMTHGAFHPRQECFVFQISRGTAISAKLPACPIFSNIFQPQFTIMTSSTSKSPVYSPPLTLPPPQTHKTTLIILHGRRSTAQKFAEPLLTHPVSPVSTVTSSTSSELSDSSKAFRDYFPHTKFVFPTAPLRRAVVFKRSLTHQWFDNWSLTQPELKQHLQIPGLRETSAYLHDLLRKEIEVVGAKNVVLMGLSQGCAASLIATLLWDGEAFGAAVGMCGYLPFRKGMAEAAEDARDGAEDPFEGSGDDEREDMLERDGEDAEGGETNFERAVEWLREELQASSEGGDDANKPLSMQSIPVFMGHGTEDEKVPCETGRLAAEFLSGIGVNVQWNEYEELGHWYSENMLRDVVTFLSGLKGWEDIVRVGK